VSVEASRTSLEPSTSGASPISSRLVASPAWENYAKREDSTKKKTGNDDDKMMRRGAGRVGPNHEACGKGIDGRAVDEGALSIVAHPSGAGHVHPEVWRHEDQPGKAILKGGPTLGDILREEGQVVSPQRLHVVKGHGHGRAAIRVLCHLNLGKKSGEN